jgi:hypothetical protein
MLGRERRLAVWVQHFGIEMPNGNAEPERGMAIGSGNAAVKIRWEEKATPGTGHNVNRALERGQRQGLDSSLSRRCGP